MGPPGPSSGQSNAQFGMFYQDAAITVPGAGGAVLLGKSTAASSGVYALGGVVHILQPGVYQMQYLVLFPVAARVNTVLSLRLGDGTILDGSICHVDKENAGQAFTAAGQTMLKVGGEVTIVLHSLRGFSIAGASDTDTLASLSVVKLA